MKSSAILVSLLIFAAATECAHAFSTCATEMFSQEAPSSHSALEQITTFGMANKIPIGLVLGDGLLCQHSLQLPPETSDLEDLRSAITNNLPGYTSEMLGALLYVHPDVISKPQLLLLNTFIESFKAPVQSHQALGMLLWTDVGRAYLPSEGYGMVTHDQTGMDLLPPFPETTSGTVLQLLTTIASGGKGGVWILWPMQSGWEKTCTITPFAIYSYHDEPQIPQMLTCKGQL